MKPSGRLAAAARRFGPDRSLPARIASAAVLAPAAIGATLAGGPFFAALVGFVTAAMVYEWARMAEGAAFRGGFVALVSAGGAAAACAAAGLYGPALGCCALGGLVGAAAASPAGERARGRTRAWIAFAAVYILAPSVALVWLREAVEHGRALVLTVFVIVWSADSGAYFAGRYLRGPRISRALSPEKTWSGVVGGAAAGGVAGAAATKLIYGEGSVIAFSAIGASLGLASVLGDLAESAFKRHFGVKDSSNLIPGHGGFLDRLDGMIFATAAMTLGLFVHMIR
ncbi:MAG: phosphatidate cytidylyltransferase [Pseudomonadota bacterium]